MNCRLVCVFHLVELVDTADSVVGQHQGPSLYAHCSGLVFGNTCSQACRTSGLAICVHTPWHKFINCFQELGFCC